MNGEEMALRNNDINSVVLVGKRVGSMSSGLDSFEFVGTWQHFATRLEVCPHAWEAYPTRSGPFPSSKSKHDSTG